MSDMEMFHLLGQSPPASLQESDWATPPPKSFSGENPLVLHSEK
jgi:hypothetical protein